MTSSCKHDFVAPSDEELRCSIEALVDRIFQKEGINAIRYLHDGYPECPTEPGLFALIAPDGVMVRVITFKTPKKDLRSVIWYDVSYRLQRSFFEQGLRDGKNFEQIMNEGFFSVPGLETTVPTRSLGCSDRAIHTQSIKYDT